MNIDLVKNNEKEQIWNLPYFTTTDDEEGSESEGDDQLGKIKEGELKPYKIEQI